MCTPTSIAIAHRGDSDTSRVALLHRAPDALARRVLRGVMVLTAGGVIWDILAEPIDLQELVDLLADTFDGSKEQITTDVAALIETLIKKGAVVLR